MSFTYSSQQLRSLQSQSLRPGRNLRKVLFRAHIWCPAAVRLQRNYQLNNNAKLSSTEAIADSTSSHSDPRLDHASVEPDWHPLNKPSGASSSSSAPIKFTGLRLATWNAHSLTNKFAYIAHVILERQLDVLAVTESRHRGADDVPLLRAAPPGYTIQDRPRDPRPDGRTGGGIAVYTRSSLRSSPIQLGMEPETFEVLCNSLSTSHSPVTLLTVYRPGSEHVTVKFFEEFTLVLESLITRNSQLIILGDFNIHVEDSMDPHSIHFSELLKQFGLQQHVREPTFVRGGTLDLVITSDDVSVQDLLIHPPSTSDHSIVKFTLPPLHAQPIHAIRVVRGWKSLDCRTFSEQIRSSALGVDPRVHDAMSVAELFDLYSNTMSELLDKLLPSCKIKTRVRPLAVWFDGECHQLRRHTHGPLKDVTGVQESLLI